MFMSNASERNYLLLWNSSCAGAGNERASLPERPGPQPLSCMQTCYPSFTGVTYEDHSSNPACYFSPRLDTSKNHSHGWMNNWNILLVCYRAMIPPFLGVFRWSTVRRIPSRLATIALIAPGITEFFENVTHHLYS